MAQHKKGLASQNQAGNLADLLFRTGILNLIVEKEKKGDTLRCPLFIGPDR
jgi:hypothetical protein